MFSEKSLLPLEGITIVALEQAVAAPFATRQLADLGARVIKVERPVVGDFARHYDTTVHGMASHFVWLNRSKESIALDLKDPTQSEVLKILLKKADVFVHNLAPGAVDRLGFDSHHLLEEYPELIICEISGYGRGGPFSEKKAYDLLIQCEAGFLSITGTEDIPSKAGISIADIASGMYAFSSILTALLMRVKTGKGTFIEISMLEALGEWMGYPLYFAEYGGTSPKRTGSSHATIYPYGAYRTRDGESVFFGLQNDREWENFCTYILGNRELANDPTYRTNANRVVHAREIDLEIRKVLQQMTADELVTRLNNAQIANAKLNRLHDFANHAQLRARDRWREVATPKGNVFALLPPGTMNGCAVKMGPVPEIGEHTQAILRELGLKLE